MAECSVYHGHGGFVLGGYTDDGMMNVWATHCDFVGTDVGLRFKSGAGHGGAVRNVTVDHIFMKDIVNEAVLFDTHYDNHPPSLGNVVTREAEPGSAAFPDFSDFDLSDIYCAGAGTAVSIAGLVNHLVARVAIRNSAIRAQRGFHATKALDVVLEKVRIDTPESPSTTFRASESWTDGKFGGLDFSVLAWGLPCANPWLPMSGSSSSTSDGMTKRAVFLSYAREDSAAAQRITDALRSQGIEVWFDQSELRGGDLWDQKIRKQIKDCALFIPIISGRTQERGEGYFRLEWKLAVERTHLMAEGVPFLSPVVVDATPEGAALVPAEFLRVQWTRLPSALPTPQFVEQVQRMLEKPSQAPAVQRSGSMTQEIKPKGNLPLIAGVVAVIGIAVGVTLFFARRPSPMPAPPPEAAALPAAAQATAAVDPKSIAVLPFANMSEEKDNEFFTDGVHEDVLTNLSFVKDLHVVSRTSVMQYRSTTKSIKTIAQELGVAYILEGSVRRVGNKVRVTGQLIDARTDEHVWAKAYDRDLNDIFAIQGELAQAIADALQSVLDPQTKGLLARRPTENTLAYDSYLKARRIVDDNYLGGDDKAVSLLEKAVSLDPNFAQAWAELASRTAFINFGATRSDEGLARAKVAIDTAVRLAPDDPAVIEALGDYYYYTSRDYARSTEQYMRLEQIKPNAPEVYFSLGLIQRRQGRYADAMVNMRKGIELDPTNRSYRGNYVDTLVQVRRYDEAIALYQKRIASDPEDMEAQWNYSLVCFCKNGSTDQMKAFAAMSFPNADPGELNYALKVNAETTGDWAEMIRLDKKQRYYGGNTQDPPFAQDIQFASCLADSGDLAGARARASEVLETIQPLILKQPSNETLWLAWAVANGLLGNRAETVRGVGKVRELMPESKDAVVGAGYATYCAYALAYAGEKERALAECERLVKVPWGFNIYEGRLSCRPLWDEPRYKALVNDPKNNEPLY